MIKQLCDSLFLTPKAVRNDNLSSLFLIQKRILCLKTGCRQTPLKKGWRHRIFRKFILIRIAREKFSKHIQTIINLFAGLILSCENYFFLHL